MLTSHRFPGILTAVLLSACMLPLTALTAAAGNDSAEDPYILFEDFESGTGQWTGRGNARKRIALNHPVDCQCAQYLARMLARPGGMHDARQPGQTAHNDREAQPQSGLSTRL